MGAWFTPSRLLGGVGLKCWGKCGGTVGMHFTSRLLMFPSLWLQFPRAPISPLPVPPIGHLLLIFRPGPVTCRHSPRAFDHTPPFPFHKAPSSHLPSATAVSSLDFNNMLIELHPFSSLPNLNCTPLCPLHRAPSLHLLSKVCHLTLPLALASIPALPVPPKRRFSHVPALSPSRAPSPRLPSRARQ